MRSRFARTLVAVLVGLGCVSVQAASAHPYSDRYYGHALTLRLAGDQVEVDYVAEIPTPVLLRQMREEFADQDSVSPADEAAFTAAIEAELRDGLSLSIDEEGAPLRVREDAEERPAVGDARFFVYRLRLVADVPSGAAHHLELLNGNYPDETSFFASEVLALSEIEVEECSLFVLRDGEIKRDESAQWRMDEEFRELSVRWSERSDLAVAAGRVFERIAGEASTENEFLSAQERTEHAEESVLLAFIKTGEMTPRLFFFALLAALFFGAAHAMSPGHGKVLVAGYLVGARGTVRHAVWLGVIVTVTHTFSVFLLGAVTLWLSDWIAPETLYPWIEVASGLMIVGIGLVLIWDRRRRWLASRRATRHHEDHHHDHSHDPDHHHHEHDHGHDHAPPDDLSWRSLVSMGISGGLAPCPSALVVLLTAIAFHRVWLGLILVTAFSVGLGLLLIAIGVAVVLMGDRLLQGRQSGWVLTALPLASALIITAIGCVFTWRGVVGFA